MFRSLANRIPRLILALALACLIFFVLLFISTLPAERDMELWGYDLLVGWSPNKSVSNQVLVVDFDDDTIDNLHQYPIPRTTLANVIDKVSAGHPDLIGLDIILSDKHGVDEDQALTTSLSSAGNVVVAAQLGSSDIPVGYPLPEFCEVDLSIPSACKKGAAFAVGFINMPVDDDGFVRRSFLLPPKHFPVLPFSVAIASNHVRQPIIPCGTESVCLGSSTIAMDDSDLRTALIAWSNPPAQVVSASDLLANRISSTLFTGKIVLIGQSSAAGNDRHFTPLFRIRQANGRHMQVSGAEIHAASISTLLDDSAIRVLHRTVLLSVIFLWVYATLTSVLCLAPRFSVPLVIAAMGAALAMAVWLFLNHHIWFQFVLCELGLLLLLPTGFGYRFLEERWWKGAVEEERAQLMNLFSRYVSEEVASEIWDRRSELILTGEERTATILFSDIRNFTEMTTGKPSAEIVAWLNAYLGAMGKVVKNNRGFLNKYIGDGIMVVYGVPISEGKTQDAVRAVNTALQMIEEVENFNLQNQHTPNYPSIKIGIGIHTGEVTAGNIGSKDRLEYSVIGEAVNLASRLESLTKEFGVGITLSPQTQELVKHQFETELLGLTAVRGFSQPISVYTVHRFNSRSQCASAEPEP